MSALAFPSGVFSTDTLTRASSPKTDRAYRLAARKLQSPLRAAAGVRHFMLVEEMMWSRKWWTSVMLVETETLFSHSNSAHIDRNWVSGQEAGLM